MGLSLIPQAHGGALLSGGKPGNAGGRRFAERQARRRERSEAINDAVTGHIERLSEIMGRLVEEAGGEQYRCLQCGSFGPKRPKLGLKDAADVVRLLMAAVKEPGEAAVVIPIQVGGRGSGRALQGGARRPAPGCRRGSGPPARAIPFRAYCHTCQVDC